MFNLLDFREILDNFDYEPIKSICSIKVDLRDPESYLNHTDFILCAYFGGGETVVAH